MTAAGAKATVQGMFSIERRRIKEQGGAGAQWADEGYTFRFPCQYVRFGRCPRAGKGGSRS